MEHLYKKDTWENRKHNKRRYTTFCANEGVETCSQFTQTIAYSMREMINENYEDGLVRDDGFYFAFKRTMIWRVSNPIENMLWINVSSAFCKTLVNLFALIRNYCYSNLTHSFLQSIGKKTITFVCICTCLKGYWGRGAWSMASFIYFRIMMFPKSKERRAEKRPWFTWIDRSCWRQTTRAQDLRNSGIFSTSLCRTDKQNP